MFGKKLDFLMTITNTKNSTLGRVLSFDPSYISRIRNGSRKMHKNKSIITNISLYFAQVIKEPYQKTAIANAINMDIEWPSDASEAEKYIYKWLSDDDDFDHEAIRNILIKFSTNKPTDSIKTSSFDSEKTISKNGYFYGNDGLRTAILNLIRSACLANNCHTLLINFSDNIKYLGSDTDYLKNLNQLLFEFIGKGGSVIMIHPLTKDFKKMIGSVEKWLPLYMTGLMEPYYYPKSKDGIYQRTLLVSEKTCALSSISICNNTNNSLTTLTDDKDAIKAFEEEFYDYYQLCKPIFNVYNPTKINQFWEVLQKFRTYNSNRIILDNNLSIYSMPIEIIDNNFKKTNNKILFNLYNQSISSFKEHMQKGYTTLEIISLPKINELEANEFKMTIGYTSDPIVITYTKNDLKLHLENIIKLLKQYKNYNIVITTRKMNNIHIYSLENYGTIIARNYPSPIAFVITEKNMTSSFWEYLTYTFATHSKKEKVIAFLEKYIKNL